MNDLRIIEAAPGRVFFKATYIANARHRITNKMNTHRIVCDIEAIKSNVDDIMRTHIYTYH